MGSIIIDVLGDDADIEDVKEVKEVKEELQLHEFRKLELALQLVEVTEK